MKKTTIAINEINQRWLDTMKRPGQTYDNVLDELRGIADPTSVLDKLREKMRNDAEIKARETYLAKIREYDEKHRGDVEAAKKALGLDLKPGETAPAWGIKNHKRKRE